MGRFHRYSFHNLCLITAQCPTATSVAGFQTCRTMGRFVRKGEKGIAILAPIVGRRKADGADGDSKSVLGTTRYYGCFVVGFYNHERPHQTLGMKVPADLYARSTRVYRGLEDVRYPFADTTVTVTHCGRICFRGRKINLSHVFAGQQVGVTQVGDHVWLVTFMHYDVGHFDDEAGRVEPIENPFGSKVLPMCSV
jgi:putative transposase